MRAQTVGQHSHLKMKQKVRNCLERGGIKMGSRPAFAVTAFVGYEESGNGGASLITDHLFAKKITK